MNKKPVKQQQSESTITTPPIQINAQYIKDLSFEAPSTPSILSEMQNNAPDVNITVNVNAKNIQNDLFEVQIEIQANCSVANETAFITELTYGGLFKINVPSEHLQAMLLIECPRLLFPFARNIVADATRDGGVPPLMIAHVDFVAMFQNQNKSDTSDNVNSSKTKKKETKK